jgi:hypothetical protein
LLLGHDQRAARYLHWDDHSAPRHYEAVWNDAAQQAMQEMLTGASAPAVGTARSLDQLGTCLSRGFAGGGSDRLLPTAFVSFLQDYASGKYREMARTKVLLIVREHGEWKITKEWLAENTPPAK